MPLMCISGDCGATYSCITSPYYTENYAPEGSRVIKLASLTLDVKDFKTEVFWDTMVVNCQNYSRSTGPVGVEACDIRFRSDGTLLVDDFAIENSLDYLLFFAGDMYSESTDPEDISVTSDALLFWSSDYSTNHKGWPLCAE